MNVTLDHLANSFLHIDSVEQCNIQDLQKLADQYPYFGAVQLLLAKKLQAGNEDQYKKQLQKASLYFNNPLWMEQLLKETGTAAIIPSATFDDVEIKKPVIPETPVNAISKETEIKAELLIQENEELIDDENQEPEPLEEVKFEGFPTLKMTPVDPGNKELVFEPYHTVDYFASQGIKFSEEVIHQDKLDKQLKSFTEWLKVLKQTPVSAITQLIEPASEQKVEELAGQSIQDREVITEAMADVWKKQGNPDKAIEIYNKLSLLDASKRPYFAAKIEELKKII